LKEASTSIKKEVDNQMKNFIRTGNKEQEKPKKVIVHDEKGKDKEEISSKITTQTCKTIKNNLNKYKEQEFEEKMGNGNSKIKGDPMSISNFKKQ